MKHILLLSSLFLLHCIASGSVYAANDSDDKKPTMQKPIIVTDDPLIHRSLEAPIFAYYAAGTITLDFVENLGAATVVINNLTAGGQVVELIDTSMGNVIIDIDSILTIGDYYMTITTMNGKVYSAEFTLE